MKRRTIFVVGAIAVAAVVLAMASFGSAGIWALSPAVGVAAASGRQAARIDLADPADALVARD